MSRATVNRHLDDLEAHGLITRVRRQNPVSRKRLSTYYILGLDASNPPNIEYSMSQNETRIEKGEKENIGQNHVSECDTDSMSQKSRKPCLKNRENHVSNCDTNPVREPVKEPCAAGASDLDEIFIDETLERFEAIYPRSGRRDAVRLALASALSGGVEPDTIIAAARAYAEEQRGNAPRYIAYPENWLERRGWDRHADRAKAGGFDPEARLRNVAELIGQGKPYLCTHVTGATVRELLHRKMVTPDQCHAAGVTW